jgi:hypothetical protein
MIIRNQKSIAWRGSGILGASIAGFRHPMLATPERAGSGDKMRLSQRIACSHIAQAPVATDNNRSPLIRRGFCGNFLTRARSLSDIEIMKRKSAAHERGYDNNRCNNIFCHG